jgi:hypothetical protein
MSIETPRTQKRRRVSDSDDDGETQGTQGAQKKQITHQVRSFCLHHLAYLLHSLIGI